MSHEIYKNAFVTYRQPAWHKLGTVFDQPLDAAEAWSLMGPYEVDKEPIYYGRNGVAERVDGKYVLVGKFPDNTNHTYGVVDKKYELVTPKNLVDLWDMTVKANIETMGTLQQGRRFFMTTELQSFDVKGDEHKNFLSLISPHGTNQSLMGIISPIRVVCWNTLQMALNSVKQEMRVWHQKGALNKIGAWMQAQYESTTTRSLEIQEALTVLANKEVKDLEFESYMEALMPVAQYDLADLSTAHETKAVQVMDARTDIHALFRGQATGADTAAFKDTAYGLYNAVVEWADYHKKGTQASARWIGVNGDLKEQAFDLALALATK